MNRVVGLANTPEPRVPSLKTQQVSRHDLGCNNVPLSQRVKVRLKVEARQADQSED